MTISTPTILGILLLILGVVFVFMVFGIAVTFAQIIASILIFTVVIILIIALKFLDSKKIDNMTVEKACKYVVEWWKENMKEELITTPIFVKPGYFGVRNPKKFYGCVFNRFKDQTPIVAIVQTNPKDLFPHSMPNALQLEDPFTGFSYREPMPTPEVPIDQRVYEEKQPSNVVYVNTPPGTQPNQTRAEEEEKKKGWFGR